MKRLYWNDTYLMKHQAKITEIGEDEDGHYLRLNETIFHPQGGGQPSDEGTINSIKVVKLKDLRAINEINHYVENIQSFTVNEMVTLEIDCEKRLQYAALHTAGHITAGVLRTQHQYHGQTSANHFPNQAKVQFKLRGSVDKEELEQQARQIIQEARAITQLVNSDGLRCIAIAGLCEDPCSGTHVNFTDEIADFQIRKIQNKKGELVVGYDAQYRTVTGLSHDQ